MKVIYNKSWLNKTFFLAVLLIRIANPKQKTTSKLVFFDLALLNNQSMYERKLKFAACDF